LQTTEDLSNQIRFSTSYKNECAKAGLPLGKYVSCECGEWMSGQTLRKMSLEATSCARCWLINNQFAMWCKEGFDFSGLPRGWTSSAPDAVNPDVFHAMYPRAMETAQPASFCVTVWLALQN